MAFALDLLPLASLNDIVIIVLELGPLCSPNKFNLQHSLLAPLQFPLLGSLGNSLCPQ